MLTFVKHPSGGGYLVPPEIAEEMRQAVAAPIAREVDRIAKENDEREALLGEILCTLRLPANQPYVHPELRALTETWWRRFVGKHSSQACDEEEKREGR